MTLNRAFPGPLKSLRELTSLAYYIRSGLLLASSKAAAERLTPVRMGN